MRQLSWLDDAKARGTGIASHIGTRTLESKPLWRVYSRDFAADSFTRTNRGWTRFSPLVLSDGSLVPTIYPTGTLEVARAPSWRPSCATCPWRRNRRSASYSRLRRAGKSAAPPA